jgi:hypothetical protein
MRQRSGYKVYNTVIYQITNDHGPGLSPSPTPPFIQLYDFINIAMGYMLIHMVWAHWSDDYTKVLHSGGGLGVEPRGLPIILHTTINQTTSDTWCPWIGPRVLIPFATKWTRVTSRFDKLPTNNACHVTPVRSYGPATSDRTDCTDCTVSIKIFACLA